MLRHLLKITPVMESTGNPEMDIHAPIFSIEATPVSEFVEEMENAGFARRGKYSWSIGMESRNYQSAMQHLYEIAPPGTLAVDQHKTTLRHIRQYREDAISSSRHARMIGRRLTNYSWNPVGEETIQEIFVRKQQHTENTGVSRWRNIFANDYSLGIISITQEERRDVVWVRLWTFSRLLENTILGLENEKGNPLLDLVPQPTMNEIARRKIPKSGWRSPKLTARETLQTFNNIRKRFADTLNGFNVEQRVAEVFDAESYFDIPENISEIFEIVANNYLVSYVHGQPSTALISVGENVPTRVKNKVPVSMRNLPVGTTRKISSQMVARIQDAAPNYVKIHPGLEDVVRMAGAKPYKDDNRLREYQKQAVGLHLSTEIGYLQSASPGMGKTVMQLVGMKARSENFRNYRGLVVVEGNVREQWREETRKWFPEATVVTVTSGKDYQKLATALSSTGPVVVIAGYSQLSNTFKFMQEQEEFEKTITEASNDTDLTAIVRPRIGIGSLLLHQPWNDVCADEGMVLGNSGTKQGRALWKIRENSEVATVLTGTPIDKSVDDLAQYISWIRNDKTMFYGAKLSQQFDPTKLEGENGAKALMRALGAIVFRRDVSEISEELPTANDPRVEKLRPAAAEQALANAAEHELRRCYTELVDALQEQAKHAESSNVAEIQATADALKEARGAWLGGTQLARLASSDPTALLQSNSTGAALLASQGLIQAAVAKPSTKRQRLVEIAAEQVRSGKQTLVFTEFSSVAKVLVQDLEAQGIKAKPFIGGGGAARDRNRIAFQNGELDVLVCTGAGKRGVTLNKASTVIHYDLPWTPKDVVQRTGRSIRLGSSVKNVQIIFLILEGTIEEKVASVVVKRSMDSLQVLDRTRGATAGKTETGLALAGLIKEAGKSKISEEAMEFAKLLETTATGQRR